jgi:deazaflavin-dependent oxidoreductase (nitroreductase family)
MSVTERLARIANASTLRLTHYGRRSGKPYDVTIWFTVDDAVVYLNTMNRDRQWTRNVLARPEVELAVGDERFVGRVTALETPESKRRPYELLAAKYWIVWLLDRAARLLGRDPAAIAAGAGRGGFYRVDLRPD